MSEAKKTYCLYRREPVKAGEYYYAVTCKSCKEPICILDDPSKGTRPQRLGGDGQLHIPCLSCGRDEFYDPAEVYPHQASKDQKTGRPERVAISKSPRQPFWRRYPKSSAIFGVGYIEDRPKAAAIVARIITGWADIEIQCARLLAELMGTNIPQAAAVFSSLRNSRAQHDALNAAAKVDLSETDYELFSAHMARKDSLESERNDLAHGCFGICLDAPDDIIWVSQADYINFSARNIADDGVTYEGRETFRKKQFLYTLGTLERIAQEVEEFYNQLGNFKGYLYARRDGKLGEGFRQKRYPQLCNQPHIQQALDQIREGKKQPSKQKKSRPSKRQGKRK